jgi:hypothetical protein
MGAVVAPIAAPVIAMRADGACRVTAAAIAMRADGARRVAAAARRSAMRRRVEGGDNRAAGLEQVKSSQVKSSQVKFKMAVANPPPLVPIAARSGGQISAQPAPLDSPESGHHPHRLVLDHRGAPGLQLRAFFRKSTVRQSNTAPGRRRERSGARARAVPMGQGVRRVWRPPAPRVERSPKGPTPQV